MKKLLFVAMVAFGAVMAQAANFRWSVSYSTSDAKTWVDNGAMAMVFAASDLDDVKKLIGKTQTGSTLQSALEGKTLKNGEGEASSATLSKYESSTGELFVTVEPQFAEVPADGKVVIAIFTDGEFTKDTKVYWTSAYSVSKYEPAEATTGYFGNPETIADIKKESLPEPGMLALLALGVAGLALRRKAA